MRVKFSAISESQRDSATKPKVARNEKPWVKVTIRNNRNAVASPERAMNENATLHSRRLTELRWSCFRFQHLPRVARLTRNPGLCYGIPLGFDAANLITEGLSATRESPALMRRDKINAVLPLASWVNKVG